MKKKKFNFFKKVFFTLLFGFCSIVLLGSWSYDPQNDTITSDNLFSSNIEIGYYYSAENGNKYSSQYWSCSEDKISVNANTNYYVSTNITSLTTYRICFYNSTSFLNSVDVNNSNGAFTTPNSCNNITIGFSTQDSLQVMLNVGSTALFWEPYGQSYINQTKYDNLEIDYEELYDNYQNLNDSYTSLQNSYNLLEANYENLQTTYNTYVANHSYTNQQYNQMREDLADTNTLYMQLEQDYQDLTNQYNSLLSQYNDLKNAYNPMGMIYNNADAYLFSYSESNTPYYYATSTSNYLAYDEDLEVRDEFNYITPSDFPNIDDYLTEQQDSGISLYWSIRLDNPTNMPFNIVFSYNEVYSVVLYNTFNNNAQSFDVGQNLYLSVNNQQEFEYNVILIRVYQKRWTWTTISTTNYNILYNQGFNEAMEQANIEINNLKKQIITYQQYIQSMQTNLEVNMRNLIWYIAETPFTSFKTIWNVDFLGLNIASFVSGLLSVWIVLFIIKKIFK